MSAKLTHVLTCLAHVGTVYNCSARHRVEEWSEDKSRLRVYYANSDECIVAATGCLSTLSTLSDV